MKAHNLARLAGLGLLAIGASIAQATFINVAFAGEPAGPVTVRISDLDLSKSGDVARLYMRIRAAALTSCGAEVLTGTHLLNSDMENCVDVAIATAVEKVHNPQLSAYLQQATKTPKAVARPG